MMNLDIKDLFLLSFPWTLLRLTFWLNPSIENKAALRTFKPLNDVRRESIEPLIASLRSFI